MTIRTMTRLTATCGLLAAAALLASGRTNVASAQQESGCLQTNHGLVCNVVKTWTCTTWATGGATFGWTSVGTIAVCEQYTETTQYFYNAATTSGGSTTTKPLF